MLRFLVLILVFLVTIPSVFAGVACPKIDTSSLFDQQEIIGKINACIEARKNGTENTIEDYSCPSGDQSSQYQVPFNKETLAYIIAGELMMDKVDEEVEKYMKELSKSRDKDIIAWTENYGKCLNGRSAKDIAIKDVYSQICTPLFIARFLNKDQPQPIIHNMSTFPQYNCNDKATKKIQAWENMASTLMHDGINKSYQNDRDRYVDSLLEKYSTVIDKFHEYQKIVTRSLSKMTHYIQNAVH